MTTNTCNTLTVDWLQRKLVSREHGILINKDEFCNFECIQDFIKKNDHSLKTSVIYYQAFPKESAIDFLGVLGEELNSKFRNPKVHTSLSLDEILNNSELKMVIIDKIHLHSLDTINSLLEFFERSNIALIFVGSYDNFERAGIIDC